MAKPHRREVPRGGGLGIKPPIELGQILWVVPASMWWAVIEIPGEHRSSIGTTCCARVVISRAPPTFSYTR